MRRDFRFRKLASVIVVSGALVWGLAASAGAQEMGAGGELISGKGLFRAHCAQCHGMDGKGDGPVAPALKAKPANLTLLSQKNGGKFPEEEVFNSIKGTSQIRAHGTGVGESPMPVWGLAFRSSTNSGAGTNFTPQQVNQKIHLLVDYIKSIQVKS